MEYNHKQSYIEYFSSKSNVTIQRHTICDIGFASRRLVKGILRVAWPPCQGSRDLHAKGRVTPMARVRWPSCQGSRVLRYKGQVTISPMTPNHRRQRGRSPSRSGGKPPHDGEGNAAWRFQNAAWPNGKRPMSKTKRRMKKRHEPLHFSPCVLRLEKT